MKRSQLREIILEAMRGYSPQVGQTKGGTTDDFRNILTAIAKGRPEEEDSEEESARRGHAILDKANPDNVARITRGEKPIYEGKDYKTMSKSQVISYVGKLDSSVKVSLPRINAGGFDKQVSQSHTPEAAAKALKATKNTGTFELWQDTDKVKKFSLKMSPEETKSHEKSVTNK